MLLCYHIFLEVNYIYIYIYLKTELGRIEYLYSIIKKWLILFPYIIIRKNAQNKD